MNSNTLSLRTFRARCSGGGLPLSYLTVFEGNQATVFHLPSRGEVVLGRGQGAELRLADPTTSRLHARLHCEAGEISIEDLGSHNGTFVNDQRVSRCVLASGDVIRVCAATLVLHRDAWPETQRALLDRAALRRRLEEEVERRQRAPGTFALLCLMAEGPEEPDAARLGPSLQVGDSVARAEGALWVLLPERTRPEAQALAAALVSARVRLGLACFPEDAGDGDGLLAAARAAAAAAAPGRWASAAEGASQRRFGEHQVLLADPVMVRLYALLQRLAQSDLPVLLLGETGVGKEVAAAALHHQSRRGPGPLVALNCAALPEQLIESELFGHAKGAFTGAVAAKVGLLESAAGGTVFLDELGELPAAAQAKLLRVLETRRITRVGELQERPIDIRLVAATCRDLEDEVKAGRFRQDLLFRLNSAVLRIPPLRHRGQEVPLLARRFLDDACARLQRDALRLSAAALQALQVYDWPGNIRELKNAMDFAAATAGELQDCVEPWDLPDRVAGTAEPAAAAPAKVPDAGGRRFRPIADELRDLERARMLEALEAAEGIQTTAAELLGMPLRTFTGKVRLYGLLDAIRGRPRRGG